MCPAARLPALAAPAPATDGSSSAGAARSPRESPGLVAEGGEEEEEEEGAASRRAQGRPAPPRRAQLAPPDPAAG